MNKNFDKKNTVKYTHKGFVGRTNRRNASRYYENTMELFSTRDYGENFEKQKQGLTMSLFSKYKGDSSKTSQLIKFANDEHGENNRISVKDALALRQNGWTLDRLLMRSRDKQYFVSNPKVTKHWGKHFEAAVAEPSLKLADVANFLVADRMVNEPSMAAKFKTAEELKEMGYELAKQAKPVVSMDGIDYYDLTACALKDGQSQFDVYAGFNIDNIQLDTLKDKTFINAMIGFGNSLHMNIVDDYGKVESADVTQRKGALSGWGHKLRASIRRANTGVRDATTTYPFVGYKGSETTPSVVMDAINNVAQIITDETFKEFYKTTSAKSTYKDNKELINGAASALLASAIVRMGMFSDKDAGIMSEVYRTNAARVIANTEEKKETVMDAIIQIYSVSMRRVANAVNLDFGTFARLSGMEYQENDLIFDQILCRPSTVNNMVNNEDAIAEGEKIVAEMIARKAAEEAEADKQNADEQEGTDDAQDASDEDISAQNDESATNADEAAKAEDEEVLLLAGPKPKRGGSAQPVSDDSVIELPAASQSVDPNAKLETSYVVKDDFGFVATDITEKNKVLRARVYKTYMRKVSEELIMPVMSGIIKEYSKDYSDTTQDDICSVIRKYNEWIENSQKSGAAKKESIKDVIAKIDNATEGESIRSNTVTIEKALNLYKLTYDLSFQVVEYKKSTPAIAEGKSKNEDINNFIKEHDGKDTMRAELTELIKSEILGIEASYEEAQAMELR